MITLAELKSDIQAAIQAGGGASVILNRVMDLPSVQTLIEESRDIVTHRNDVIRLRALQGKVVTHCCESEDFTPDTSIPEMRELLCQPIAVCSACGNSAYLKRA